ncbi:WD40 repeat domain-containing protein [Campylobacter sp. US33a]|uniref:WD40 repeat domain-containing protein n=1 Tax=Campylobacter sp. CCS1377 TaxID=3158229 RepID=A0AAU7E3V9_9BACT|nr:WD40 repeat domain-containing protein [Campylobacter sp. US33a]MCW1360337.1 WD40 repeat domain-containing protein [Campylobacter jejuni]TEY01584.1 WD40 repeat domain-containing protein [Campylobacter sp. US33a]
MKKLLFILIFLCVYGFSYELKIKSNITALKVSEELLYIGTDRGEILRYNIKSKILDEILTLADIQNYYEKNIKPSIYSIDVLDNKILLVSEGDFGSKNIWIFRDKNLDKKLSFNGVKEVFFINEDEILLTFLGANIKQIKLSNLQERNYNFSYSSLNDASIDKNKKTLVLGFESGVIEIFDLQKWEVIKKINKIHKDNIYQVDYKNGNIISCATDRRVGIVIKNEEKFIENNFLIYACALSSNGEFGAFSNNATNFTQIIKTKDLTQQIQISNEDLMVEYIIFLNEHDILISGYGNKIIFRSFK